MADLHVLCGPPRAGKTRLLLDRYTAAVRRLQDRQQSGRTLWLAPTHLVVAQMRRKLSEQLGATLLQPGILTFEAFAEQVLQRSRQVLRPVPPVMQRTLLRRLIDEAQRAGQLAHFAPIANTAGFLDLVQSLIAELKSEECWPENLEQACQQRGLQGGDQELANLYRRYQEVLLETGRYDVEGRFWAALNQFPPPEPDAPPEFELVVVDGFSDFTQTQYQLLQRLALRSRESWVSLPLESGGRRDDLFAKPAAAFARLNELPGLQVRRYEPAPLQTPLGMIPGGLEQLARTLFVNPRLLTPSPDATGLRILAATGPRGEVRWLAEEIKRLLLLGVPASDICVAIRPLSDYADLVREVFTASGVPLQLEFASPLDRQPLLRGVLALLQLEAEDWPFERLLALLNASWFHPNWHEWSPHLPGWLARFLLEADIPSGRDAILQAVRQAAAIPSPQQDIAEHCAMVLGHLAELTRGWHRSHSWMAWTDSLLHACRSIGMWPPPASSQTPQLNAVWQTWEEALAVASGTEALFGLTPRNLTLAEFLRELQSLLQRHPSPPEKQRTGVLVVDAPQVRALEVPYLFLAGLTERSFPARTGEAGFYSESDRRELNEQGLRLSQRTALLQSEMLLFQGIVTRATRQLTLLYPALGMNGQPLSPSPYLTILQELFTPEALPVQHREEFDPIPPADRVLSDADWRIYSTAEALHGRPGQFAALNATPRTQPVALSIATAVDMAWSRFHRRGFTPYEGWLEEGHLLRYLQEKFSQQHEFSASQLEGYARCPFRFWLEHVLRLAPLGIPEDGTDHARRGVLIHQVLADLHLQWNAREQAADLAELSALFQRLVTEKLQQTGSPVPFQQAMLDVEQRLLVEWAGQYGVHYESYQTKNLKETNNSADLTPRQFELDFGQPYDSNSPGEWPSLRLGTGPQETRVRGRIDRIDVAEISGQPVFRIIDYKTGKAPDSTASAVQQGRSLQLLLYTLAVQRLEICGADAVPFPPAYWLLKEEGFKSLTNAKAPQLVDTGWEENDAWQDMVARIEEVVPQLAAGIRRGEFPIYNSEKDCTSFCPFKTVCRVSQVRALEEPLGKSWEPRGS